MPLLLMIPLVTIHLAAVSVASIGPLFAIWLKWRGDRFDDRTSDALGRLLALRSIQLFVLGIVLGLIQLALASHGNDAAYVQALGAIAPRRWWFAGVEGVFSLVCLVIYYMTWNRWQRYRWAHALLAAVAATNLIYHFPTLFVLAGVISERPGMWSSQIDVRMMIVDPDVLARVAHFVLASITVCGIYAMWLASRMARGADADGLRRCGVIASRVALTATFLQLPLGVAVLVQLSGGLRDRLLGGDLLATGCLGLGVILSIVLLQNLAGAALGDLDQGLVTRSAGLILLVVLLMVAARLRMRERIDRGSLTHKEGRVSSRLDC